MLIIRSYLATGFKTYKESIIGANVRMFRSQCLVVSGVREGKECVTDVPQFQLVEGVFPKENIPYIYGVEQLKNNGFSFTKIGIKFTKFVIYVCFIDL
jgi:hypothetical protein